MISSRFALIACLALGCLLPQTAMAQGAIRVPRLAAGSDAAAHAVWASCVSVVKTEKHFVAVGLSAPAASSSPREPGKLPARVP